MAMTTVSVNMYNGLRVINHSPDDDLELDRVGLFYNKEKNLFEDEGGFIVWDIFNWITPNDLYLFKHYKEDMLVQHQFIKGLYCELYYPCDFED